MDQLIKEELKAKLEAVKELKQQYYLGSKAAYHLVKEKQKSLDLENKLKKEIAKKGISPNFGPSYIELEEVNESINNINNSISASIERAYKTFSGNYLPMNEREEKYNIYTSLEDLFLKNFALNRSKLAEQKEINPKQKAFILTLENYVTVLLSKYQDFFERRNIPKEVLKEGIRISKEKILRDANLFLKTSFFEGRKEANRLEFTNMTGGKYSDVLFDRLENEQILYKDEMQKIYLSRFIAERNIKNYGDFLDIIQFENDTMGDNKKEYEYLKLISNRHKNWIKNFLSN